MAIIKERLLLSTCARDGLSSLKSIQLGYRGIGKKVFIQRKCARAKRRSVSAQDGTELC
jgi:hypothetical protein